MNKYILSFLYDSPTEQIEEVKQPKKKKLGKKSKQESKVKDPGPIIKGYLSKTAPFDFDVFIFNPDDDDEKRFYIRKLFSQFQKLDYIKKYKEGEIVEKNETGHNYITDEQYARIRISNILLSIQQLNHYVYTKCHSEEEIFLILQYGTMLIQVSSFEVNLEFNQIYRQLLQREDDIKELYNFHLDLYEEIFVFIDFIQKNRLEIAQFLKNYGEKIITNIVDSKIEPKLFENYSIVFDLQEYDNVNLQIEKSIKTQIETSNFSRKLNEYLKYLNELDFCVTLHHFIASDDFLYSFTKEYTEFDDLMIPLLVLYKFDYDLFANSPTYFRLFFYFFQSKIYEKKNEKSSDKKSDSDEDTNKLKHIFNSFRFTISELYNHLFFGEYNKYVQPLKYNLDYMNKKDYDEKMNSTSSLFSYSKTAHMFSISPIGIFSDSKQNSKDEKPTKSIQYAFYPIAETALNILTNQLNSWCIHVSDKLSIDLPDGLLKYIRHWTAHEYLLYQQFGIKVKEATKVAIQQNVSSETTKKTIQTPNNTKKLQPLTEKPQKQSRLFLKEPKGNMCQASTVYSLSNNEGGSNTVMSPNNEGESNTDELSKTYRVIYHYVSFLTSIIQDQFFKLDYKKSAYSFYLLQRNDERKNEEKNKQNVKEIKEDIHPFLNFSQLYKLAQILGPEGMKYVSTNVIHDFNLSMMKLIDMFSLIDKTKKRSTEKSGNYENEKTIGWHKNKIAEYLAEAGNLSYLRELLKFVTQTYIRNYHPVLYMDLNKIIAKKNAVYSLKKYGGKKRMQFIYDKDFKKFAKDINSYDKLIDLFDMEEDCKLTENLYKYLKEKQYDINLTLEKVNLISESFESVYYLDLNSEQISDLAMARGIDELFSLLYYYKKVESKTSLNMSQIDEVHRKLIKFIENNHSKNEDKKKSIFAKVYFHESSYFHRNFSIHKTENDNKRKRGIPYDSLLVDTTEWIDIVENIMKSSNIQ